MCVTSHNETALENCRKKDALSDNLRSLAEKSCYANYGRKLQSGACAMDYNPVPKAMRVHQELHAHRQCGPRIPRCVNDAINKGTTKKLHLH